MTHTLQFLAVLVVAALVIKLEVRRSRATVDSCDSGLSGDAAGGAVPSAPPPVGTGALGRWIGARPREGSRRCRWGRRHLWGRPFTEDGRRLEECEACCARRPHLWLVETAAPVTQASLDGSVTRTTTFLDPHATQVLDERAEHYARVAAAALARNERARFEAAGLTSEVQQ